MATRRMARALEPAESHGAGHIAPYCHVGITMGPVGADAGAPLMAWGARGVGTVLCQAQCPSLPRQKDLKFCLQKILPRTLPDVADHCPVS